MNPTESSKKAADALTQLCGSVYNAMQAHHLIIGMTEEAREYVSMVYQRELQQRHKKPPRDGNHEGGTEK